MDKKHLKALLSKETLNIATKCATGAAAAATVVIVGGVATEANAATSAQAVEVRTAGNIAVTPAREGAILLNLVGIDASTGMIVADHYSHSSHVSHHSHYSGR